MWLLGGVLAMLGAFIWAELATRLPGAGGQYLYLREAYHPSVAFVYGWVLLLVTQTGGMAAVAVTFARYFREITRHRRRSDGAIAAATLLGLTAINCLGVRAGSNVQSALMLLKVGRHRGDGGGWDCAGAAARFTLCRCSIGPFRLGLLERHRRGHDSGRLRVWRLADRDASSPARCAIRGAIFRADWCWA